MEKITVKIKTKKKINIEWVIIAILLFIVTFMVAGMMIEKHIIDNAEIPTGDNSRWFLTVPSDKITQRQLKIFGLCLFYSDIDYKMIDSPKEEKRIYKKLFFRSKKDHQQAMGIVRAIVWAGDLEIELPNPNEAKTESQDTE